MQQQTPRDYTHHSLESIRHDTNNVFFALRPSLNLLRSKMQSATESPDANCIRGISDAVSYIQSLLDHADDHSAGHTIPHTDFHEWWNTTHPLLRSVLPPNVRLLRSRSGKLPRIAIAPIRFTQAILNLILNSGDAIMRRSIQSGVITIEAAKQHSARNKSRVRITIRDNAGGMSARMLKSAFKQNASTKAGGRGGLGLHIVQDIVRESGGTVELESSPGFGTAISLVLPFANARATRTGTSTSRTKISKIASRTQRVSQPEK